MATAADIPKAIPIAAAAGRLTRPISPPRRPSNRRSPAVHTPEV
jgi:hypothetical protein